MSRKGRDSINELIEMQIEISEELHDYIKAESRRAQIDESILAWLLMYRGRRLWEAEVAPQKSAEKAKNGFYYFSGVLDPEAEEKAEKRDKHLRYAKLILQGIVMFILGALAAHIRLH